MKEFEMLGKVVKSTDDVLDRLARATLEGVLYEIYMPQPLADKDSVNNALREHRTDVSSLASLLKAHAETRQEAEIVQELEDYSANLSKTEVNDGEFSAQQNKLADEIASRISGVVEKSKTCKYDRDYFLNYVRIGREGYDYMQKKLESWACEHASASQPNL